MATITDIKRRIQELAAAPFQEFCDTLIFKNEYGLVHGYGMKSGTGNTTIGNPDTYFRKENGKYVFVAYTIQQSRIYYKLKEDIDKCLDSTKTRLAIEEIEEIICCHTSSNLSAGDDKNLHDYCESQGISLTIWGLDEIANQIQDRYKSMAKDFLGLSIDTGQIMSIEDFVESCDANGMSAPLKTDFLYRDKEKEEIMKAIEESPVVIITGRAGVGKTRLVLETIKAFVATHDYKLLCVKNNNLGLYDDLISQTEKPGKYLFFIDDANELAELNQILEYTTKTHLGYTVKIIVTVRDYAKSQVSASIKEYTFPKQIEISSFSDEEIKGFLNDILEIRNKDYVNQIIRIAEGNPRIAYMAGRLAVEEQNLAAVKDVSQLYDVYYKNYVNSTLGEDRDLCFTVGVLSVVNAVVLNNVSAFRELIVSYGITEDEFRDKIQQLSKLEAVEIQLDQVATLSDQCLANYMLYYVFFQRKIIPLSRVLELGYKYFRNGVIRSINTIFNLFESEETKIHCEQEILIAWDNLKNENHPCYENYVQDFHVFRPEEAFIMAQEKIENIESEEFNIYDIDFSENNFREDESILALLSGYQSCDDLNCVMELLLEYASRTSKNVVLGYKWLENNYGISVSDYKYKYHTQRKISEYLLELVSNNNTIAMALGFQWAKYSLGFSFHSAEMERGNTFVFYNLEVKQSEDLDEYRKLCWKILAVLSTKTEWRDKVLLFLDDYSRNIHGAADRNIVVNDAKNVEQLLLTLNCNNINFLKALKMILNNAAKLGINYNKKWGEAFTGKVWELYQILEDDFVSSELEYEEYEKIRKSELSEYGTKILDSDISTLVQDVNSILSDLVVKHDSYQINQGLELIVQQFDNLQLAEFLNTFIKFGDNISIHPCIVLESLNQRGNSKVLLDKIKEACFPQKNEWLYSFFDTLPESEINFEMLEELLIFLKDDSDKEITTSKYRRLRVLDKFLSIKPDIYPVASKIIYEKRNYSNYVVKIYFKLLFHDQIYSPEELLELYKADITILQDIYFLMLKYGAIGDLNGTFLIKFLSLGEPWLQRYSEVFWAHKKNSVNYDYYRNNNLWKSDDFINYFDYIFYNFPEEKPYRWRIGYTFKDALTHSENDDVIKSHQEEWIVHIITENASSEWIDSIFEIVCELDDDIKRKAIQTFVDNNSDFETFDRLLLIPNYWSGSGSLVPEYQKKIDYLESLFPIVSGVKFLKHKAKIKSKVEILKEMIKQEEVEVIYRNLYM